MASVPCCYGAHPVARRNDMVALAHGISASPGNYVAGFSNAAAGGRVVGLGYSGNEVRGPRPLEIPKALPSNESNEAPENDSEILAPEDRSYFLKLTVGCVAAAIAIKYGSLLVPYITRPNLFQALAMIATPVVVSVLALLAAGSRAS